MILKVINHSFGYDMKNICTVFFPYEKIREQGREDITVITEMKNGELIADASAYDRRVKKTHILLQNEDTATAMSVLLYNALSELTGYKPPWGILFGVRPAKLMHRFTEMYGEEGAIKYFTDNFLTSPSKARLAAEVMKHENRTIAISAENSFSLYVSIPFCPTRCSYCSFVSHSIERTQKLMEPYTDLLCRELERTAQIAKELNLRLETIYFGGGTPTTLSPLQLKKLFNTIEKSFDLSTLREYTVEAGRPDTVSAEKLNVLKNAGVTRISINPQTFNDDVLKNIGRRHTVMQTVEAFELARNMGFDNINTDLIAGLPGDCLESFKASVDKASALGADSVTVHTLALKSASYMVTRENTFDLTDRLTTARMVDYSIQCLTDKEYYPYYMYRQKYMAGNMENVGYAKPGSICIYNIDMMEDSLSIIAHGAGAMNKRVFPSGGRIERVPNPKDIETYISKLQKTHADRLALFCNE